MSQSRVHAQFKFTLIDAQSYEIIQETDWNNNVVLDSGRDRMLVGNYAEHLCIGTGTAAPATSQTGLETYLGKTTTTQGTDVKAVIDSDSASIERTFRFPAGAGSLTGLITEAGLGWNASGSDNNCFNRVTFAGVNKTTNNILDVKVKLIVNLTTNLSNTYTVTENGTAKTPTTTAKVRPYIGSISAFISWPVGSVGVNRVYVYESTAASNPDNINLTTINGSKIAELTIGTPTVNATNRTLTYTITADANTANFKHHGLFIGLKNMLGYDSLDSGITYVHGFDVSNKVDFGSGVEFEKNTSHNSVVYTITLDL